MTDVRLHITEGMSRHIMSLVEDETAHLGCIYEFADPEQFVAVPLLTEEMFLVAAVDDWPGEIGADGFALDPIPVARLGELPLVLPNNSHGARVILDRAAKACGTQLNVVTQIDPLPQIIEMVDRASAYTILPQTSVVRQVQSGRLALVRIEGAPMKRTCTIIRKRSRPVSASMVALQELIYAIVGEMIDRFALSATVLGDGDRP